MIIFQLLRYAIILIRGYVYLFKKEDHWAVYLWVSISLHAIALLALPWALVGNLFAIALTVSALTLAYPWLLCRKIFIRLSMWRTSFVFGWLARVALGPQGHGALVAAAWALHRKPTARGLEFIGRRIQKAKLSSPLILASALLSSARGDRAGALTMLQSLSSFDPAENRRAHRLAGEFLLAAAAEAGDWRRLRRIATSWEPSSRTARLFGAVASRILGDFDAPKNNVLIGLWSLAPARRRTRPLLKLALATPLPAADLFAESSQRPPARSVTALENGDALSSALAIHLALARRGTDRVEFDDLLVLGRAWDNVEKTGALQRIASSRAADLESREPSRVSAEFIREVRGDLARMVRDSGHRLDRIPRDSPALSRAATQVREDVLATVELGFVALEQRTEEHADLPAIDEWREFTALRALHTKLVQTGGLDLRRLAFTQLHHAACNHAARLWNDRQEYLLANAIFRWLLAEATIVGDSRAIELQRKNCDVA